MKDFVGNFEMFCSFARTRNLLFTKFSILASDHYQKMGRLKDVERCLVHLDLVNLDIDQVKILRSLYFILRSTREIELRCLLMLLSTTYTGHILRSLLYEMTLQSLACIFQEFNLGPFHVPIYSIAILVFLRLWSYVGNMSSMMLWFMSTTVEWEILELHWRYWMLRYNPSDKATFYDVRITKNTFTTSWILARWRNGMVMAVQYNYYALKLFLRNFCEF